MARRGSSGRIAERVVHHHGVGHGREDGAQAVLAVQPLVDEGLRPWRWRAWCEAFGKRGSATRSTASRAKKKARPRLLLVRAAGQAARWSPAGCDEQLVDGDAARVAGARLQGAQHQQRHDHGARPVGDLGQVDREPPGQEHDLHRHLRHGAPGDHAEQRQQDAGEDVAGPGAAVGQERLAGADHVRRVDVVADHLQREIGLHGGADVEGAAVIERPAAVLALDAAQIDADLALQLQVASGSPR